MRASQRRTAVSWRRTRRGRAGCRAGVSRGGARVGGPGRRGPAYAPGSAGVQVEAPTGRRLRRGTRLTAPDDPEGKVSRTEFDEMVRDLHVDPEPRRTAVAEPPPKTKPEPPPPQEDGAADAL